MHRTVGLWLGLTLAGCASGPAREPIERIPRVPSYILSIQDLDARVRRARQDLGVQLRGVRVAAILLRTSCSAGGPAVGEGEPCAEGATTYHVFETRSEDGPGEMLMEIPGGDPGLEAGHTYVLIGDVEASGAARKRWILRGYVLAVVGR